MSEMPKNASEEHNERSLNNLCDNSRAKQSEYQPFSGSFGAINQDNGSQSSSKSMAKGAEIQASHVEIDPYSNSANPNQTRQQNANRHSKALNTAQSQDPGTKTAYLNLLN